MQYIFGYGSLICKDSRKRTGVSGEAHPIEVKGISRKWSLHSPEWPATALSAHVDQNAFCNGVCFEVDSDNLEKFDQREAGYHRIKVSWDYVEHLSNVKIPSSSTLWAYVGNQTGVPNSERPIMQSYLDVILNGCLDYSEEFTKRFTELTEHWQHLVDDRHAPMYPRPLKTAERIPHIEQVVATHLPELLRTRTRLNRP
jgi:cation transport regulator ChaC